MLVIISKIKAKIDTIRTLRLQVLIAVVLVGILPLMLLTGILSSTYRTKAISQRISELQARGSVIANLLQSSALLTNEVTSEVDSELIQVSDFYGGRIMIVDRSFAVLRDTYGLEEHKSLIVPEVVRLIQSNDTERVLNQEQGVAEIYIPIESSSKKTVLGVVVMTFSSDNIERLYDEIAGISWTITLLIFVLLIIFATLFANRMVQPLKMIREMIHHITDGRHGEPLELKGYREAEEISDSLNEMTRSLHNLENSRQEFVSNVSHELKTPITSMKVLADSLIMQEEAPLELYKEFMGDINDELERMNQIVNDLLALVKLDKSVAVVEAKEVNINEFLEGILKRLHPIAAKRNIEIIYESFRPVVAQIDEVKMGMAFNNLVENAIKYNYDDGWVRVSLNADHKFFYVKVTDSGEGIPEEYQEHIFERFYRVDKARSRDTGGNGLGLAITRSAILLHRGSIKVHSEEQQGTMFNIRIPLIYLGNSK